MAKSLFQKYGGFAAISRVVMTFYEKVLDSDQIGGFFEDVDIARLVDHQTKFVASLLGGPASFGDSQLEQIHANLGISHEDFDEMAKLLAEALTEHGFEPADLNAVISAVDARRDHVVSQDGG